MSSIRPRTHAGHPRHGYDISTVSSLTSGCPRAAVFLEEVIAMRVREASELIQHAVQGIGPMWADLGAGSGTFTEALVELLGPGAHIYSVDRDRRAVEAVRTWALAKAPGVIPVVGDFTEPLELPGLNGGELDGVLFANSLHYVRDADQVLARSVERLRPGGRVVLIEYDQHRATHWVPYPIPADRLGTLAIQAGITDPVITVTRKSHYGGQLYVAVAERPGDDGD